MHICGNATGIMERMVSLGADVLEIDQKTDLKTAREIAEGKCALLGQISLITLNGGDREEIQKEVKHCLDTIGGMKVSWHILGPGCALGGDTAPESIEWMIRCARGSE